eukprot:11218475-Lingulodinium_polyedra.AAC.1
MEDSLRALLADFEIHEDVLTYFGSVGMRTMDDFAVHLDSRAEVQAKILDHVSSQRDSVAASFRLKQAWR